MKRERVGIRELRQNLSVYVKRVLEGDCFDVTDHGRPVAILAPLPDGSTVISRLVREGRATPPLGDLLELAPPAGRATDAASKALRRARDERL